MLPVHLKAGLGQQVCIRAELGHVYDPQCTWALSPRLPSVGCELPQGQPELIEAET